VGIPLVRQWLGFEETSSRVGDFTTTLRVIPLSLMAVAIGVLNAFVALALLNLVGIFTDLFFFQRWDTTLVPPASNTLGVWELWGPVIGALIGTLWLRAHSRARHP
jgi:chloride channel protein, CIC family